MAMIKIKIPNYVNDNSRCYYHVVEAPPQWVIKPQKGFQVRKAVKARGNQLVLVHVKEKKTPHGLRLMMGWDDDDVMIWPLARAQLDAWASYMEEVSFIEDE